MVKRAVSGDAEVADLVHRLAFKLRAATYGGSHGVCYCWSRSEPVQPGPW
jgi:hypothetical protein